MGLRHPVPQTWLIGSGGYNILLPLGGKQRLDWLILTQTHTHTHTHMNIDLYIHIRRTDGFSRETTVGLADNHTPPRAEYAMCLFQNLFSFICVSCRLLCHVICTWHGTRMERNTRRASFRTCFFGRDSFICAHSYKIHVLIDMSRLSLFQNLHLWDATHVNGHMSFSQKSEIYVLIQESYESRLAHELTHELSFQNERMSFPQKQVAGHICETLIWCHICETYVYTRNICLYAKHISICET